MSRTTRFIPELNVRTVVLLASLCVVNGACAHYTKPTPTPTPTPGPAVDEPTVPFSVTFTTSGTPVVLSARGERLPQHPLTFPKSATTLNQLYSFSAVEALGSNFIVYCVAPRTCWCIDLPHPNGSVGNSCSRP